MRRLVRPFILGAVVGVALLSVPAAAFAAGPGNNGGPGNSGAAHKCQKGGYVNYATSGGTAFTNTDQCVSYAAQGGTLVPLPDLVPTADCTSSSTGADCSFEVKNIGIGPAVGKFELQAGLVMNVTDPTSLTNLSPTATADGCDAAEVTGQGGSVNPVLTLTASATCNNITIQPGATATVMSVQVGADATGTPGTIAVNSAVITPVLESNTNNNTFSQTFTITGT